MAQQPAVPDGIAAAVTDLTAVRLARQQAEMSSIRTPAVSASVSALATSGPSPVPTTAAAPNTAPTRRVANRRFDTEKVARLKREIEQGRYRIDPFSTADRFIEHERNGR